MQGDKPALWFNLRQDFLGLGGMGEMILSQRSRKENLTNLWLKESQGEFQKSNLKEVVRPEIRE